MSQLWQLTVCELVLQLKSKTFWLIGMLAVITMFFPNFAVLLIQFAVISAVARDERSGFVVLAMALPYATVKLLLARAAAVFFLLLGLWPVMVLVVGVDGFFGGWKPVEWLLNGRYLAFVTLKYITTCATAIGFVFLAGAVMGSSPRLYLFVGICWAIGWWVASNLAFFPAWSALFVFGHGVMLPGAPSLAGYFPQEDLLPGFAAFQGAMALLFLLMAAAWQMRKRGEKAWRSKLLVTLAVLAVFAGSLAGTVVWRELAERETAFRMGFQETERAAAVALQEPAVSQPQLAAYHLDIKLRTAAHCLEGRAVIKFRLTDSLPETILFTLRNYLAVEAVVDAGSGKKIEWRRDGSRLMVQVPEGYRQGEELTLAISYSGRVWEWFAGRLAQPNGLVNCIAEPFSLLRSGYAWYPVPGDQPLYERKSYTGPWNELPETTLWAVRALHPAVPFELTVDTDAGGAVVSNLEQQGVDVLTGEYKQRYHFRSTGANDVFLLTGPYYCQKRQVPGRDNFVEIYSYRQHQERNDEVLALLVKPYLFFEELFQPERFSGFDAPKAGRKYIVAEMPPFFFYTMEGRPAKNLTLTDTVVVSEAYFRSSNQRLATQADMRGQKRDMAVLQRWWKEDIISNADARVGTIAEGSMLYSYVLLLEKTRGRAFYEYVKKELLKGGRSVGGEESKLALLVAGPVVRDVFMVLDAVRTAEDGETAVRETLSRLYPVYAGQGKVDPADFSAVVETVLREKEWPQGKRQEIRLRLESIAQYAANPGSAKLNLKLDIIDSMGLTIIPFYLDEWIM